MNLEHAILARRPLGSAHDDLPARSGRCLANAYSAMLAESDRLGLPTSFRTDLTVHDRRVVENRPGARFLWAVGEMGTHLVEIEGSRIDARKLVRALTEVGYRNLYQIEDETVRPVDPATAIELLEGGAS